jgi:hypothetical protein
VAQRFTAAVNALVLKTALAAIAEADVATVLGELQNGANSIGVDPNFLAVRVGELN